MIQRLFVLLLLLAVLTPPVGAAEAVAPANAKKPAPAATVPLPKKPAIPAKPIEQRYLDGLVCLEIQDSACAQVELAFINPASSYAKLLQAAIAASGGDFETALRLLIPLKAENNLIPRAHASLHATLARAYVLQENPLPALEHYVKAATYLPAEQQDTNQAALWKVIAGLPREVLLEMRGEGSDDEIQGWIDLAIAAGYSERRAKNIEQWRTAYPNHPVSEKLLASITALQQQESAKPVSAGVSGKIALLLPLESPAFAAAAQAVQAGFMAAHALEATPPEVQVYATGSPAQAVEVYKMAVYEGAQWVVGPLPRDEVSALSGMLLQVPTLVLNQPEKDFKAQDNLLMLPLSAEAEARQVARQVRELGLQTAQVVMADAPLAKRVAQAFSDEWKRLDGTLNTPATIPEAGKLGTLKAVSQSADMIFLAADAARARVVRPFMDTATPTYGISQLYDGSPKALGALDMLAVRFVDMPWMLEADNPDYASLRVAAAEFKGADLQRLFALGVDAYRLLPRLQDKLAGKVLLEGLTGRISSGQNGLLQRELPLAQFRREGVVLENQP
jgi:outer membrane PBP1 activator LpoA protein